VRDQWLGWSDEQRRRQLHLITNNTRFLILPWVGVRHLASYLLGQITARLSADWQQKYGHPIVSVRQTPWNSKLQIFDVFAGHSVRRLLTSALFSETSTV
jgi:hypothetical protein